MSEAICETCAKPHPHPDGFMPKHPFNDGSVPVSATFGRRRSDGSRGPAQTAQQVSQGHQPPPLPPMPFDPVLRQALINRGVLTPQDLRDAEEMIRAVTAAFERGEDGQQQGRQEGLRLQEPTRRLPGAASAGEVEEDSGHDR